MPADQSPRSQDHVPSLAVAVRAGIAWGRFEGLLLRNRRNAPRTTAPRRKLKKWKSILRKLLRKIGKAFSRAGDRGMR